MMPKRIQLQRTKGWRKPEAAIVVSRPSKWGNMFRVGDPSPWGDHEPMDRAACVEAYKYATGSVNYRLGSPHWSPNPQFAAAVRAHLAGHDLACWCPLDEPCHADLLLTVAAAGGVRGQ
jgi:hypothetical protein